MKEFTSVTPDGEEEFNPLAGVKISLDAVVFECLGAISILEDSELADMAAAGVRTEDPRGRARLARSLRLAFGDEVYERFREHCAAKPVTPDSVILAVLAEINARVQENLEAELGRPTEPPVPSSDGPAGTEDRTSRVMKLGGNVITAVPPPPDVPPAVRRRKQSAKRPVAEAKDAAAG